MTIELENGSGPLPLLRSMKGRIRCSCRIKRYYQPEQLSAIFMVDLWNSLRFFESPKDDDVYMTDIIPNRNVRARFDEMTEAKRQDIMNRLERGTFKVILHENIPRDANVLPGRFVLALKSTENGKILHKARYDIGSHRDRLKHMMNHSTYTVQPSSIRLLLALAATHGFDVWTSEVRQAYLQSAEPLARGVSPNQFLSLSWPRPNVSNS